MSKDKAKEKPQTPPEEGASGSGKQKKLIIVLIVLIIGLLAGGGYYFFLGGNKAQAAHAEPKKPPAPPPIFFTLETLTVNLPPGDQFLQVATTLQLSDAKFSGDLKLRMPELRHRILLLMSSKSADTLSTAEGKIALAKDIRNEANALLGFKPKKAAAPAPAVSQEASGTTGTPAPEAAPPAAPAQDEPPPVQSCFFTSFIVQ